MDVAQCAGVVSSLVALVVIMKQQIHIEQPTRPPDKLDAQVAENHEVSIFSLSCHCPASEAGGVLTTKGLNLQPPF
jgi:hypothetical protein